MLDTSVFRYEYLEDEGLVSIFANDEFVTQLADENGDPESVFAWFVNTYSKTNLALNYAGVVAWREPTDIPVVERDTTKQFWIAVEVARHKTCRTDPDPKVHVRLATYANKPVDLDEDGEPVDCDPLVNVDGEFVEMIGWVDDVQHDDFESYNIPITFNESYRLMGWAEYIPPSFTQE